MGEIHFFSEEVPFKLKNIRRTKDWINRIVRGEGLKLSSLTYIFCSDRYLLSFNKKYLKHNTLTDILTFGFSKDPIEAEIYISVERVEENAKVYKKGFEEETRRVLIHGVLHLLGYNDKTPTEKAHMRKKEEACLSLY